MLKIDKNENSLFVEGMGHDQFPYDGAVIYPLNSLVIELDESDMAVFHSAANWDVAFSGKISEITIDGKAVTKETIAEAFGEISNVPQGGGEGGTTDYNKLSNKPSINGQTLQGSVELPIPTKTSELTNDSGFVDASIVDGYAKSADIADEYQPKGDYATKDEIPSLDGYATESWVEDKHYLTEHQDISGKQDVITDLETIREGAAKGATAIQEHQSLADYAKTADVEATYQPKGDYATKDEIPSLDGYATEAWVEGKHYLTEHQDISGKQDVIADLETIREGAAKGATAIQEHQDISGKLDKTEAAETYQPKGDYLTSETDPIYTADKPNLALKSEIPSLDGYATEEWVEGKNYLTEHQDISGKLDKTEAAETYQVKGNYATKDEIPSLDGYATEEWVEGKHYLTEHQDISGKQDVITDLETIREGAAKGATAIQEHQSLEGYATEAWVNEQGFLTQHQDISGKADKDSVYTKEESDAKYLTEHQDISGKLDKTEAAETYQPKGNYLTEETDPVYTADKPNLALKSEIPSLDGYATESWVEGKHYLTEHQDISGKLDKSEAEETYQVKGNYATKDEIPSLDGYATEEWVNEQGYLTEHQSLKTINGETIVGDGNITIEAGNGYIISCDFADSYKLRFLLRDGNGNNITDASYSGTLYEPNGSANLSLRVENNWYVGSYYTNNIAVRVSFSKDGKSLAEGLFPLYKHLQPYLKSGTNIKTINGKSILGSGNIEIQGGGGDETDPIWTAEKVNYYTKTEADGKFLTEHQDISGKQDVIADLETIREGAALGATAIQEHQSLEGYATESWVGEQGYLTEHQPLKTINGETIVGDGNIEIQGGDETDPIFMASPAATITEQDIAKWNQGGGSSTSYYDYQVVESVSDINYNIDTPYVYDNTNKVWLVKNNKGEYEEWGKIVTASDLASITTYKGKLAVVGNTEYEFNGTTWVNVGEISKEWTPVVWEAGKILPRNLRVSRSSYGKQMYFSVNHPDGSYSSGELWSETFGNYQYTNQSGEITYDSSWYYFTASDTVTQDYVMSNVYQKPESDVVYYGLGTTYPKNYDDSIFAVFSLSNGLLYNNAEEIVKKSNLDYNIGGTLYIWNGSKFMPSGKQYEEVYFTFRTMGDATFAGAKDFGIETLYDENFNIINEGDTIKNYKWHYGALNKKVVGYSSSHTTPVIDGLYEVKFPLGTTEIGQYAFYGCNGLSSLHLPDTLQSIGRSAFYGCTALLSTGFSFNEGLISIGSEAFRGCWGIETLSFPASLKTIGDGAFRACTGLTAVVCGNSLESIGMNAFNGCTKLSSLNLGSVKKLKQSCFEGCSALKILVLPSSITSLPYYCFSNCALKQITMPDTITSFDGHCFEGNNSSGTLICSKVWFGNLPITQVNYMHPVGNWTKLDVNQDLVDLKNNLANNYYTKTEIDEMLKR